MPPPPREGQANSLLLPLAKVFYVTYPCLSRRKADLIPFTARLTTGPTAGQRVFLQEAPGIAVSLGLGSLLDVRLGSGRDHLSMAVCEE